jgi:hypothetical protein
MKHLRTLLAAVAVTMTIAPAVVHAEGPNVPAALQVPAGQVLLFRAFATGTQNYACDAATSKWVFLQPMADLTDDNGAPMGIHGRGPFWASYDGSRAVGSSPLSAPSIDPGNDVPLLLLKATPGDTDGRFSGVTFVQRLDTHGGAAPAAPCDADQEPTLEVPYQAVYYFYGPA